MTTTYHFKSETVIERYIDELASKTELEKMNKPLPKLPSFQDELDKEGLI